MKRYYLTRTADRDLDEIHDYISEDNPAAADELVGRIETLCQALANMPEMGRPRFEFDPGLRSVPEGRYLIFYQPVEDGIEVIRILHGARDIEKLFS